MQQSQIDDLGFCPSFSCYSCDSQASTAARRISTQLQEDQLARFHDLDEDEFEFSLVIGDDVLSVEDIDSGGRTVFPLFNRDLLIQSVVDGDFREIDGGKHDEEEEETACTNSLRKLFISEREETASSSSSEEEASDGEAPVFCVWRHKTDAGASPLTKCKKSSSTGSGSKRWRIRDLLRRSNSEGKERPMVLLSQRKVEIPKQKLSSGEASISAGKSKPSSPSIHELFYVQQRAKREVIKRKSYLPYRQGLVALFSNVNGMGKKSTF